jgi:hypothetical protein
MFTAQRMISLTSQRLGVQCLLIGSREAWLTLVLKMRNANDNHLLPGFSVCLIGSDLISNPLSLTTKSNYAEFNLVHGSTVWTLLFQAWRSDSQLTAEWIRPTSNIEAWNQPFIIIGDETNWFDMAFLKYSIVFWPLFTSLNLHLNGIMKTVLILSWHDVN